MRDIHHVLGQKITSLTNRNFISKKHFQSIMAFQRKIDNRFSKFHLKYISPI